MGILAIDFGGTRTRAAFYSDAVEQIARDETRSLVDQPAEAVIERILQTARNVIPSGETISAIGISAPGPLDAKAGIILGAARGCDPVIYLTLSTGIGGGAILNGQLFTGWSGLAIEPGHMRFMLPSGQVRRLEELASGSAIGSIARTRLETSESYSSLRACTIVDGQAVGEAAQAGDRFACELIQEAGEWLGLGLVNLLHLFSPQVIVVGGSVSKLGDLLLRPAWKVLHAQILDPGFIPPNLIRLAELGDDVCLVGAALYAARHS